ncbi:MAG: AMP-binding protein [Bacteroidia bacterium]|nr:AMP-binding protein [Bacteroidia bacterium]NNJ55775.1 AMP-binding protein [Bacteroidia bacterium]
MAFTAKHSRNFKEIHFLEELVAQWQKGSPTFILESSGSTGAPRKIELSRELLIWSCEETKKRLKLENEKVFCCLPIQKTGGFMQVIRALHFGWEIYLTEPHQNPFETEENLDCTMTSITPYQLTKIMAESEDSLNSFRNVIIGGSHIEPDSIEAIEKFNSKNPNVTFWESYGMTETASHIALRNISEKEKLFTPNEGVTVETIHGQLGLEIVPLGLRFETTDLVVIRNNQFKILGRVDDVINSGGLKIHPAEIEPQIKDILRGLRINRRLYLGKKSNHDLGEMAVLVIEGTPIKDSEFVLEVLRRELPTYMSPKELIFVDKIRTTTNGKLIRSSI